MYFIKTLEKGLDTLTLHAWYMVGIGTSGRPVSGEVFEGAIYVSFSHSSVSRIEHLLLD